MILESLIFSSSQVIKENVKLVNLADFYLKSTELKMFVECGVVNAFAQNLLALSQWMRQFFRYILH